MRVMLDTNVLASAVATRGLCADVLRAVLAEHELAISSQMIDTVAELKIMSPRQFWQELTEESE